MKLVNSRGRVLLEVVSAHATGMDANGFVGLTYQYRGDGCGGNVDIVGLHRTIEAIKLDAPSAKLVGTLPEPVLDISLPEAIAAEGKRAWQFYLTHNTGESQ